MRDTKRIWKAIQTQNIDLLSLAIKDSRDANILSIDGDRPLHKCCEFGFNSAISLLISKGADPFLLGKDKCSPVFICACVDNPEGLVQFELIAPGTLKLSVLNEILFVAASHNSVQVVKFLLSKGVEPNLQDPNADGRTALHWSAQQGNVEVTEILLVGGAKPGVLDIDGFSPLHVAAAENEHIILKMLIDAGGDPSLKCKGDIASTPLHMACTWGHIEAARVLLDANADKCSRNLLGQLPIDIARQSGNQKLLDLF
jgi:ankyrin repeat protein